MRNRRQSLEISCQQVLTEDSSVFSVQWIDIPARLSSGITPALLLQRYLDYIRSCSFSLIRPVSGDQGVEFRLGATRISLISFLPPEHADRSATLRICGGALVQPRQCDRGELRFGAEDIDGKIRVSLQLSDFCPLILGSSSPSLFRYWSYRLTQAAIHRLVTVRFLSLFFRDLSGLHVTATVENVAVRKGRPV